MVGFFGQDFRPKWTLEIKFLSGIITFAEGKRIASKKEEKLKGTLDEMFAGQSKGERQSEKENERRDSICEY